MSARQSLARNGNLLRCVETGVREGIAIGALIRGVVCLVIALLATCFEPARVTDLSAPRRALALSGRGSRNTCRFQVLAPGLADEVRAHTGADAEHENDQHECDHSAL